MVSASGATTMPEAGWVFSYIAPRDLAPALKELRAFLHRLGREARQGEVGLVMDGHYIGITRFED